MESMTSNSSPRLMQNSGKKELVLSLLWADPMDSLAFQLSDSPMVWRICPDLGAHLLAFESFSLSPWRNPTPTASTPPPRR